MEAEFAEIIGASVLATVGVGADGKFPTEAVSTGSASSEPPVTGLKPKDESSWANADPVGASPSARLSSRHRTDAG